MNENMKELGAEGQIIVPHSKLSEFDLRLEYDDTLNKIVNSINNENIKHTLYKIFEAVPDYFYTIPASSTGKYHPQYALGKGGLYRHTLAACLIAQDLINLEMFELTSNEKDYILCALLLHDTCKLGIPAEKYTKFDHPLLAAKLVELETTDREFINNVTPLIKSHMGQWNKSQYCKEELPKPQTKLEKIVHLCDYLASRKYLEVKFNG